MKDDIALIRAAQQKDQLAFRKLVAHYDSKISVLIFSIVQNQQDTEDLYQDVFLKVWKNIGKFRFESDFYTWLYAIAVNSCYNFKQRRQTESLESETEDEGVRFSKDSEDKVQLRRSISRLPLRQRTMVILFYLEEQSVKSIAILLAVHEGTVKKYLARARENMRKGWHDE